MFSETFTLTKQHLGWILTTIGVFGFIGIFSIDLLTIARESGFISLFTAEAITYLRSPLGIGPAQRIALMVCIAVLIVGLTLLPLGKRPA